MALRGSFIISSNLLDKEVSFECDWQLIQPNGSQQFNNLYVAPKLREGSSPVKLAADPGVYISDGGASSGNHLLTSPKALEIIAFLQCHISQKCGISIFQIPRNSGFVMHSDPWAFRVADCALVSSTKSFLSPLQHVVANNNSISTVGDIVKALHASAGAVASPLPFCDETINKLELQLERRLSLTWLSEERIRPRRLCFLIWSRIAAKRAGVWAIAKALGIQVVVISSGAWSKEDKPISHYGLDGYIDVDVTTDSGFWRRIVDAVKSYPDPIDGICGPWDPFMVDTARAAEHLGLFTAGPGAYTISTNKYLTRRMLDPEEKDFFTVESLEELEKRLESSSVVNFPVVCKPCAGLSSWGVYKANNPSQLRDIVAKSLLVSRDSADARVVIEPYVDGPEVDCNLVLLDGRVLYSEVVDDFPCAADIAEDPTGMLFAETQAAVPSKLPRDEQQTIIDGVLAAVLQQGFRTGVFHCEARIRNSSMKYVVEEGATIPDLKMLENANGSKETSVFLHEVNARMPGPMSSASTVISKGIDFSALLVLCTVGDWARYEALASPFLREDLCDHAWLINCIVPVSLERILPLFPGYSPDQLHHQAVDPMYSPLMELSKTHSDLTDYVARHNVYIEPATRLGGNEGNWLWTTCMVLSSSISREHALHLAQNLPAVYEALVEQKYN